jgi:hypothetical protein
VHDGVRAQFAAKQEKIVKGIAFRQQVRDPVPRLAGLIGAAREVADPPQDGPRVARRGHDASAHGSRLLSHGPPRPLP